MLTGYNELSIKQDSQIGADLEFNDRRRKRRYLIIYIQGHPQLAIVVGLLILQWKLHDNKWHSMPVKERIGGGRKRLL